MSGDIRISIGRLALHGFAPSEARRVEAGFRAELARLRGGDVPRQASRASHLALRIVAHGGPEHTGSMAARALLRGLDE